MKRILMAMAVCLACCFTTAQAQFKFGLKGGLNVSSVRLNSSVFDGSNRAGFHVGPTLEFTLPLGWLGLEISALYDTYKVAMKGEDENGNLTKPSSTLRYVDVPLNVNAGFGLGSFAKIFISTGPQIAFSLGDSKILDYKYDLKNSLFSWNAGLNVRLFKHYQVGYTYNVGIGNTAELSAKDVNPLKLSEKLKNSTHKITLSYYF